MFACMKHMCVWVRVPHKSLGWVRTGAKNNRRTAAAAAGRQRIAWKRFCKFCKFHRGKKKNETKSFHAYANLDRFMEMHKVHALVTDADW